MAEGQVLQEQIGIALQECAEGADDEDEEFGHRGRVAERASDPSESPDQIPVRRAGWYSDSLLPSHSLERPPTVRGGLSPILRDQDVQF